MRRRKFAKCVLNKRKEGYTKKDAKELCRKEENKKT
jgi:hypothetical protein